MPRDPQAALIARMVLIHEWRRVVLRDPHLPAAILPLDWPGGDARGRAAALYDALYEASERWLDENGVNEEGVLPAADPALRRHFT